MAYIPTTPGAATLHSIMDPNGGTLYKDAPCTNAATADGDIVLGNKDATGVNVAGKIGSRNALLRIVGGVKSLRVDNASISSSAAGAALKWTTGALDPGACTIFWVYKPDRRGKLVTDMILDPGNSPGGTGLTVCQMGHDSGLLRSSGGSGWGAVAFPFVAPDKDAEIYCLRTDNGVSPARVVRADHVDSGGALRSLGLGRTITSTPGATGWILGGRNAADIFTQSHFYLAVAFNGVMTDGEVAAEIAAIRGYLTGLGLVLTPAGTAPKLITNGDSNSMGTGATQTATEWGQLLQTGVLSAGIAGLTYESFGAASRRFGEVAGIERSVIDAANATTGRVVYVCHCGENDLTVSSDTTVWNDARSHFENIKAGTSNLRIVWLGVPARTDISGATLTNYDTSRANLRATLLADPTMGGVLDGYVDITGDSGLGATGASNTTTYFNGDKVHYNDAGQTRVYNGTNGTGQTLLNTVLPLFSTDSVPPEVASAAVSEGGTAIVVTYTEASSPPVLPGVGGANVAGYGVTVGGQPVAVLLGRATGSLEHTLYLGAPVFAGQAVLLAYNSVGGNVTDSATPAGQAMASFSDLPATNHSAQTGGGQVILGGGHIPFGRRGR